MTRIIPIKSKSLDFELWQRVKSTGTTNINTVRGIQGHWYWIEQQDKGRGIHHTTSDKSQLFDANGRDHFDGDSTSVVDFVGLPPTMISWFQYISNETNRKVLIEDITEKVRKDIEKNDEKARKEQLESLLSTINHTWLELNWEVLGRILGSAVVHYGKQHGMWNKKTGNTVTNSMDFWVNLPNSSNSLSQPQWDDLIQTSREKGIDPSIEIIRAIGHQISAPFFVDLDDGVNTYVANPLAIKHRDKMKMVFEKIHTGDLFDEMFEVKTGKTKFTVHMKNGKSKDFYDRVKANSFALKQRNWVNIYGELIISTFGQYLEALGRGDVAEFVLGVQGMCAFHLDRTDDEQMRLGMQLFTNLAVSRTLRNVEMINVPDLAKDLATRLPLSKVLRILWEHGIVRWVTIEQRHIASAQASLKI